MPEPERSGLYFEIVFLVYFRIIFYYFKKRANRYRKISVFYIIDPYL